jgi:GTP-binding protein Era
MKTTNKTKTNVTNPHSGYVALLGRTNVGKSTFLNALLETKVSIVSDKPQTTRRQILGIKTGPRGQIIFFDSPGIHVPRFRLNEKMMKDVHNSFMDADLLLYFIEIDDKREDEFIMEMIKKVPKPTFLVINKIDKYKKSRALERIDFFKGLYDWQEIVPISALKEENLGVLEDLIYRYLPEGENFFPDDAYTQQSERFYIGELIREKILNLTRAELPFTTTVKVEEIEDRDKVVYVRAEIYVETLSQKKIVLGKKGSLIKRIGEDARRDIEEYFDHKVYLDLHVRIVPNWRNSPQVLQEIFD